MWITNSFACCRGISFDKLGRFEDAVADFTEVLRLERLNVNAYFNRFVAIHASNALVQMPAHPEKVVYAHVWLTHSVVVGNAGDRPMMR